MDKVVRDGQVAVLVSPGYGAGWSTWNTRGYSSDRDYSECLFDPEIVALVESGATALDVELLAERKWPNGYWSAGNLTVEWVPQGTRFWVHEYDGSERIVIIGPDYGFVA